MANSSLRSRVSSSLPDNTRNALFAAIKIILKAFQPIVIQELITDNRKPVLRIENSGFQAVGEVLRLLGLHDQPGGSTEILSEYDADIRFTPAGDRRTPWCAAARPRCARNPALRRIAR